MLSIGDAAPDFALESDSGEVVRLEDLRGRNVILYFYPKDDTPGCTKQACGFRDRSEDLERKGWTVLGVSPDPVDSHRKFRDRYDLGFALLSDPDHAVAEAYGAWGTKKLYGREYEGILRSTFLIDAEGRVAGVYEKVRPDGHADALLDAL